MRPSGRRSGSMIRIEDLTFTYPGAEKETLKNISLHVEKGDFLAVIGNNGCGKSTLCKALNGLIPHFIAGDMTGRVWIDGQNTAERDVGRLAEKVGYVYQDFENQIVRPTVLDDASFSCLNYGCEDYLEKGREALKMCGLEGREEDFVWQLSGGQKHLLALAGAAALCPDVLILDEPIAQLDPLHAGQTYEILKRLNEDYGKTIIVIEHHTEYIARYCRHAVLMRDGRILWKLEAKEALRRIRDLQESSIFPPQTALAAMRLKEQGCLPDDVRLPVTVEEGGQAFASCRYHRPLPGRRSAVPADGRETVLSFEDVSVEYRAVKGENTRSLNHFFLDVKRGQKVAVIGSNGAGKSTMMKLLTGTLKAAEGRVTVCGRDAGKTKPEKLADCLSYVYQNPEEMFIKDSIGADIAYAMKARGVKDWEEQTRLLLSQFGLTQLQERDGRLLSGGQMRRASLAIGVALNPSVLLLDEPTANLDIATRAEILDTLERLKDVTETVLIATHDMQLVCQWAERILVLHQGSLIADGTRDEIFADERLARLVGIRPPEIFAMGRALDERARCYTVDEFVECFGNASVNVRPEKEAFAVCAGG